jgi:hypothetical protein
MAIHGHISGKQMKRLQTLWGFFCRQRQRRMESGHGSYLS